MPVLNWSKFSRVSIRTKAVFSSWQPCWTITASYTITREKVTQRKQRPHWPSPSPQDVIWCPRPRPSLRALYKLSWNHELGFALTIPSSGINWKTGRDGNSPVPAKDSHCCCTACQEPCWREEKLTTIIHVENFRLHIRKQEKSEFLQQGPYLCR